MWIRRPNVINRRLLGAVIRLEKPLSKVSGLSDPRAVEFCSEVTLGELIQQQEGHTSSEEAPDEEDSKLIVRELLPRVSGQRIHPSLELLVIGMVSQLSKLHT